jgi:hypothetical protein
MDKIRILLGNEMTSRTKSILESFAHSIVSHFASSIDEEQSKNEFLVGVSAILNALRSGKIECHVVE